MVLEPLWFRGHKWRSCFEACAVMSRLSEEAAGLAFRSSGCDGIPQSSTSFWLCSRLGCCNNLEFVSSAKWQANLRKKKKYYYALWKQSHSQTSSEFQWKIGNALIFFPVSPSFNNSSLFLIFLCSMWVASLVLQVLEHPVRVFFCFWPALNNMPHPLRICMHVYIHPTWSVGMESFHRSKPWLQPDFTLQYVQCKPLFAHV